MLVRLVSSVAVAAFSLAATVSTATASADFLFDGPEFQANTVTSLLQQGFGRFVARNAAGSYVVVWHDFSQVTDLDGWYGITVRGRLYDRTGYAIGPDFLISSYSTDRWNREPQVAMASDGGFVVVWSKGENLGQQDLNDVYGRKYDSTGTPEGPEFRISAEAPGSQGGAMITAAGDGSFIVVWTDTGPPPTWYTTVKVRRLDATGTPAGSEFQVSAPYAGAFAVEAATDGSFVVGYNEGGNAFARRYSNTDVPVGAGFQINPSYGPTSSVGGVTMALTPDGGFVAGYVVGPDPLLGGQWPALYARRFSAADAPLAPDFRISTWPTGVRYYLSVAAAPDGGFVFVWMSAPDEFVAEDVAQDGSAAGIFGQRYDPAGTPLGSEFQVNSFWRGSQSSPAVAADGTGDIVVAWIGDQQDGSYSGIFAQRLCQDADDDLLCDNRSCGNGNPESALHEQCDDGDNDAGDGCDGFCRNEESAVDVVTTGGTVTTDPGDVGATPESPVETSITVPSGGAVTVLATSATSGTGFTALGRELQITAPAQTAADPLVLTIRLDASLIPDGEDENSVKVYRNGVVVAPCTGAAGVADPDPCVDERTLLGDGDVEFRILTSAASVWKLGIPAVCDATPRTDCLTGTATSLQIKNKRSDAQDRIKLKISKGDAFDQADLGDPVLARTYALCIYDESANTPTLIGPGVRIDPNASWVSKAPKGFSYVDKTGAEDGVAKVLLRAGETGKASIGVGAKGLGVPMPPPIDGNDRYFSQDAKVIVQLVNDETPLCWSAEFTTATKNEAGQFKAKAP